MRVTWDFDAQEALADFYARLPLEQQRALAEVVDRINAALAQFPHEVGESRAGPYRVLIVRPVTYYFTVRGSDVHVVRFHVPSPPGAAGAR